MTTQDKNKEGEVTAWSVTGTVDYGKLLKDFGAEAIDTKLMEKFQRHLKWIFFRLQKVSRTLLEQLKKYQN